LSTPQPDLITKTPTPLHSHALIAMADLNRGCVARHLLPYFKRAFGNMVCASTAPAKPVPVSGAARRADEKTITTAADSNFLPTQQYSEFGHTCSLQATSRH